MSEALIISIKEFRKIAGKSAERFSDEQVVGLINDLDFIATLFIKKKLGLEEPDSTDLNTVPKSAQDD